MMLILAMIFFAITAIWNLAWWWFAPGKLSRTAYRLGAFLLNLLLLGIGFALVYFDPDLGYIIYIPGGAFILQVMA